MTNPSRSVTPRTASHNLPAALSRFLGRESEILEIKRAVATHRLTTLTGVGGCGKTRLAMEVASTLITDFPDGVWLVELAATQEDKDVARDVARVFGLREEASRAPLATLQQELQARELLLVLDNCEHLLTGCADVAASLLSSAPGVCVLTTTREPLGVEGEWTWRVPSLDAASGSTLFIERSRLVRPTYDPGEEDRAAILALVQQLDGLPLAIELAAARSRVMQPAKILESLHDRFRLLTGGSRQKLARQQTLEASVAWSYELLSVDEQALAQRLAVMRDFDLDAANAVGAGVGQRSVVEGLTRLVDKSLLVADHESRETRYRFLETIRQFLLTRLQRSGQIAAVRQRHLEHFLALAERYAPFLAHREGPRYLADLQANLHSLDGALDWAETSHETSAMLRLVTALGLFYELGGHLVHGGRCFARAIALQATHPAPVGAPEEKRSLVARAQWGAAHVAFYGGHYLDAVGYAEAALEAARKAGDQWAEGRALNTLGAAHSLGDPVMSRQLLANSVALGRATGDNWAVGDGVKMTTVAWYAQHDDAGVQPVLDELRRVGESLGSRFFLAWQQAMVGYFARDRGDLEEASVALATAEAHSRYVGDPSTGGFVECWLAALDMDTGRFDSARTRLERFLQSASAAGSELALPEALIALGTLLLGHDDAAGAKTLVEPHVDAMEEMGLWGFAGYMLCIVGAAERRLGDRDAAKRALDRAAEKTAALGNIYVDAMLRAERGQLARGDEDRSEAEQHLHAALAMFVSVGAKPQAIQALETLAWIAWADESDAEATRVLSAMQSLRSRLGLVHSPFDAAAHRQLVDSLRERMEDEAFRSEWSAAAGTSLDDCVAYATRMRGHRGRPSVGWASLTPTELKVAALVAEGLTNAQIGERLFMARGTAKIHVAHIFTKLGIATRAQLAALTVVKLRN